MARSNEDVLQQMIDAGMPLLPAHLDVCGKLRRFGPKKRGWYTLYENTARSGARYVTGAFGWWGLVDAVRVAASVEVDEDERAERRERARLAREAEERKRREAAERAAMRAATRWAAAARTGVSLYLRRKGVDAEAVRFEPDGSILVPMIRYDLPRERALVGLQVIGSDGTKRFGKGTAKKAAAVRLGSALIDPHGPILICEGLATGLTLRMACQQRYPVFAAFDAGNLVPVARVIRRLYPSAWLLFCADDDFLTWGNPGLSKALHAAMVARNADVAKPYFRGRGARKLTDYNDLHAERGLDEVAAQLSAAITNARTYGQRRIAA